MPNRHTGTPQERQALDAYVKLSRALATIDARIHQPLAREGLTASRFGVLEALHHLGPMHQRELGSKILKSSGNITMVVDHLERDGLVARERDTLDRRLIRVHLTPAGRKTIARVYGPHVQRIVNAFAALTPQETNTLAALAKTLGTGARAEAKRKQKPQAKRARKEPA